MQNQLTKPDDVRIAEEAIWRYTEPYGNDGYIRASTLLLAVRGIVWRNGICTEAGAVKTWRMLEGKMIDMEWLLEMVNEYVYRIGIDRLRNEIADRQADAICWMSTTVGLPPEYPKLSSAKVDAKALLAKAPVMQFLFSLSQCDYQQRLADVGIERIIAGQKPTKPQAAAAAGNANAVPGAKP